MALWDIGVKSHHVSSDKDGVVRLWPLLVLLLQISEGYLAALLICFASKKTVDEWHSLGRKLESNFREDLLLERSLCHLAR